MKWSNVFLWQALFKNGQIFEIGHEIASLAILFLSLRPANFSSNRNVALHARSLGPPWARHLETSTVFSGIGNIIQNDLIEAIGDAIRYEGDKYSSICCCRSRRVNGCHKQRSDLCHYVTKSEVACEVKEAFLGFDDVSNNRQAAAISFSCPSCCHLFMFVYFTWCTASIILVSLWSKLVHVVAHQ